MTIEQNKTWERQTAPHLTVVMIGHRRADLLERAISSFVLHAPRADWELVLVLNGASLEVREYAEQLRLSAQFPLSTVSISECRPGAARNFGVKVARAPILFFLDDDIECFQDIATAAIEVFNNPLIQAAGGANLTPPQSGMLARATGGAMSTWLGAASMSQRYRLTKEGITNEHGLILCNLAVRKSVFESERGFASHLISNEENVLLQRLTAQGAKLWCAPKLAVYHCRRDSWRGLGSQAAKYGAGRAQNLLLLPKTLHPLYFLPLLLLAYFAASPFFSAWYGWQAMAPLALYLGTVLGFSLGNAFRLRDAAQLLGILVFPCLHLSYGFGFLRALLQWGFRRARLLEHGEESWRIAR
jgi:succinoglycan biosynthesis protein ExoA